MNLARWERMINGPLTAAAIIFLVDYAWRVLGDLHGPQAAAAGALLLAAWAVFIVDYLVRLWLAPQRRLWLRTHLLDLLVVLLPALRPLRLLRVFAVLRVFQRTAGAALRASVSIYTAGASAVLIFMSALAVLDVERSAPGATITSFGNSLWWSLETIATVGYGDYTPITVPGRLIAAGMMLGGVALIGIVTATLASWIVERVQEVTSRSRFSEAPLSTKDTPTIVRGNEEDSMKGFVDNIEHLSGANTDFRRVLYTGTRLQLVLMALAPGEEIGEEVHVDKDQFFRVEQGSGEILIDGTVTPIDSGTAMIVPAGARHNVRNLGTEPLKLYTIYGPPAHMDGIVRATKADAESSEEHFDGTTTE